jgi:hypothetical protein
MHLLAHIRKRLPWLLGGLVVLLLGCLIGLWFLVHYRLRQSLHLWVANESKGHFMFEAGEAGISFTQKALHLRDVRLYTPDTAGKEIACDIRIPEIWLSIASWKTLMMEKKLMVDSLAIQSPIIWIRTAAHQAAAQQTVAQQAPNHQAPNHQTPNHQTPNQQALTQQASIQQARTHQAWQLKDGEATLDSVLRHLNVHAFSLLGGQLRLDASENAGRLRAKDLDIVIKDFARNKEAALGFVPTHSFALSASRLDWVGPGSIQHLSIGRLRFDTHSQRFEADSVFFQQQSGTEDPYRLTADRCYFQSKDLAAALANKRFLLDTLVCVNPVLEEPLSHSKRSPASPAANPIYISVKYIGVVNGRISLRSSSSTNQLTLRRSNSAGQLSTRRSNSSSQLSTRSTNCRIYGLSIDATRESPIQTDSVRIRLDKLMFTTKDELYTLTIDNFGLEGNDAIFREVHYGPTQNNNTGKYTTFTAPLLRLKNIDIEQLLAGHLHATGAQLTAPHVTMIQKEATTPASNAQQKITLFYHTLHHLKEIIDAGSLDIADGEIHYSQKAPQPIDAVATGFSAHILLNGILGSDNLVDIKHAIPEAGLKKFHASIGGNEISIDEYQLAGTKHHSEEKEVHIRLKNGWILNIRRLAWAELDWDALQRNTIIRIDSLHIGQIDIRRSTPIPPAQSQSVSATFPSAQPANATLSSAQPQPANPPPAPHLDITDLSIDTLSFIQTNEKQDLRFTAGALRLKTIQTIDNAIHWEQAIAILHDLQWQNDKARFTAKQIQLDSKKGLDAVDVEGTSQINQGRVEVAAPFVQLETSIPTSQLPQNSLLRIPKATIHATRLTGHDSLEGSAQLKLTATLPSLNAASVLNLDCSWKNADIDFRSADKNLHITDLAGHLNTDTLQKDKQPDWRGWLKLTTIDKATIKFNTPALNAGVQTLSWRPAESKLSLKKISIHPTVSRDSFFHKSQWQGDYLTGEANEGILEGLQFKGDAKKPAITIKNIRLTGATIEASRNKNIPFHHGIEKPMPTKLLASIKTEVEVGKITIDNSRVLYNELSAITNRWGRITLDDLDATLGPLTNRAANKDALNQATAKAPQTPGPPTPGTANDTLTLDASARLFDGHIRRFQYKESYADPNSGFEARASFSPLDLTRLSDISSPAAAVTITGGHVDTAWAVWRGNRYAAYGFMGLRYHDLRVRILDKKDSARAGFLPALETFAANILLPGHNKKGSVIYFERNPEKFVFNYWIKTQTSGIVSTLLHKKNESYRRLYADHYRQFDLPPTGLITGPW